MKLRKNILANFIGRGWTAIVGLIFVPVYIRYIGIEAYGLLGVFAAFQAILNLLDVGLSTTLNRELARYSVVSGNEQYMRNLVRTLEIIYISASIMAGIGLSVAAFFFATDWVHTNQLSEQVVINSFVLMAINFALQFPSSLYQGGMMGLQKQVQLNVILLSITTAKAIGSIIVLAFISHTIYAFLLWQIFLSTIQFFLIRSSLWHQLPSSKHTPHFDITTLRNSGRYALGMTTISILGLLLTQVDKIILSRIIRLNEFGYYSLAFSITASLALMIYPITTAVFPKMTELIAKGDKEEVNRIFHVTSQFVAILIIPLGISVSIFSKELLITWTRDINIAKETGPILRFLILGTMMNCLMIVPYQYTLAAGWTRFSIQVNLVALFFFLPFIFIVASKYGAKGCAVAWMILHTANLIFATQYLFSRQLTTEKWKWYINDVAKPLFVCSGLAIPFFFIHKYIGMNNVSSIFLWGLCLITCFLGSTYIATPALRIPFLESMKGLKKFKLKNT